MFLVETAKSSTTRLDPAQRTAKTVSSREFFGFSLRDVKGTKDIDVNKSIALKLAKFKGSRSARKELEDIMRIRLHDSETAMNTTLQSARNLIYITTIANIRSAITQLRDLGLAHTLAVAPTPLVIEMIRPKRAFIIGFAAARAI